ncbi:HotDog domain-containing protein [Hyaloraphidium curvatum]|nr:HotDog domain-containing protein [Hyaloraphidium curvatum]
MALLRVCRAAPARNRHAFGPRFVSAAAAAALLAHRPPPHEFSYSLRDLLLYNASVGAGSDGGELHLTWEGADGFCAVPTFYTVPAYRARAGLPELFPEVFADAPNVLLSQSLDVHRPVPLPPSPSTPLVLLTRLAVPSVHTTSNGKHGILLTRAETFHAGEKLATNTAAVMLSGRPFPGAPPLPAPAPPPPPLRDPEPASEDRIPTNASYVFRLALGDANPIHTDPAFARAAGFRAPLLHGVCTMAWGLRAALGKLGVRMGDVRGVEAGFRAPVLNGDTVHVKCWRTEEGAGYAVECAGKEAVRGQVRLRRGGGGLAGMVRWE